MRIVARTLIAVSFFLTGLAETLSATGLVVELAPRLLWGMEPHTLPLGGPVQMAGAILLFSGRKTAWALAMLLSYLILGTIFSSIPGIFRPDIGDAALAGFVSNLAVVGGMLYWLHSEKVPHDPRLTVPEPSHGTASPSQSSASRIGYAPNPVPFPGDEEQAPRFPARAGVRSLVR